MLLVSDSSLLMLHSSNSHEVLSRFQPTIQTHHYCCLQDVLPDSSVSFFWVICFQQSWLFCCDFIPNNFSPLICCWAWMKQKKKDLQVIILKVMFALEFSRMSRRPLSPFPFISSVLLHYICTHQVFSFLIIFELYRNKNIMSNTIPHHLTMPFNSERFNKGWE